MYHTNPISGSQEMLDGKMDKHCTYALVSDSLNPISFRFTYPNVLFLSNLKNRVVLLNYIIHKGIFQ